jgi:flotillin
MIFTFINFAGSIFNLYRIVPVNEAHVRVMFNKRDVFMSRAKANSKSDELREDNLLDYKPSYWYVPFVTSVTKMPLDNIRIDVDEVKLNDKNMAKFTCDVIVFVNIDNPLLCAERTALTTESVYYEGKMPQVSKDFAAIIESNMRSVTTKFDLLEIFKDRSKLDDAITSQIQDVFLKWGLRLVNLEIKDIKDSPGSTIIIDIEAKQAAVISADARVKTAEEKRRAGISEAENLKQTEMVKAQTEEEWKKRHIEKEQRLSIAQQEKIMQESDKEREANEKRVEAKSKFEVGSAEIEKQKVQKQSEANKIRIELEAQAQASQIEYLAEAQKNKSVLEAEGKAFEITNQGNAEAAIIKSKLLAEAEGKDELQKALNKFEDKAIRALVAERMIEMQQAVGIEGAKALANADMRIFSGSDNGQGFDIGKMVSAMGVSNESTAAAINNKIARPMDLGMTALALDKVKDEKDKPKTK